MALDHIDKIIALIRASDTKETAKMDLMKEFSFSDKQAEAILEMKLQKLAGLERKKIEDEYKETIKLIERLKGILDSEEKRYSIIRDELLQIKEKYGDARRTEIVYNYEEFSLEDIIAEEDVVEYRLRADIFAVTVERDRSFQVLCRPGSE